MHLLTILPLVCVFFCTANGLLTTHTASQNGPQPTSRQSSSSQFFSSNGTSPSSQRLPSSQQRSTGSVAVETDEPFLSTGKDTPKHEIQQNSSGPLNTTKLAFKGNPSSSSNTTLQEDTAAQKFTYNVWTVDSTDSDGNEAIWNYLRSSLGVDGFDIKVIGPSLDLSDVDAFRLELSMDQYKKLNAGSKQLRNLDFVAQSCVTGCGPISNFIEEPPVEASGFSKRDETQFYRPWDLAYLSQPKVFAEGVGASLQDINGRYAYDETSAKNVTIYLLDTGANPDHVEFSKINSTWEWAGPNYEKNAAGGYPIGVPGDIPDEPGKPAHGTMMLSVLAGANIGAVKNPLMVIVRPQEQYGLVQFLENIDYVIWHWRTHRDDGRIKMGIMSMSVMLGNVQNNRPARMSRDDEEALDNIRKRLAECIKAGLLPITATGNDGGRVDSWPALFRSTQNWNYGLPPLSEVPLPQLVVVGASDSVGRTWTYVDAEGTIRGSQTADFVDLTAPGFWIRTASSLDPKSYIWRNGTSFACARTAGLAAYLAGLPSITKQWKAATPFSTRLNKVRTTLLNLAYPRKLNDPKFLKGVWNGISCIVDSFPGSNMVPIYGYGSRNQKRDGACPYEPAPISSGISLPQNSTSSIASTKATSISLPQSSTSSITSIKATSISLPQFRTSIIAPTKATSSVSEPSASLVTNIQYTNSTVQTGNLFGSAINEFIVDGMKGNCPPTPDGVSISCNGGKPFSKAVEFMVPGDGNYIIQEANVSVAIPLSNYSSTANRDGMIAVHGAFMENMAKNGSAHCKTSTSTWEDDDCQPEKQKRDGTLPGSPGSIPGFKCKKSVTMTYCQVPYILQLEITENNEVTQYMTIEISFTVEGLGLVSWLCKEFSAFAGDFMEYFAPELTEEYPQVVGDVQTSCDEHLADWIG